MKKIELTQGYKAIVDVEDYERLKKIPWRIWRGKGSKERYAVGWIKIDGKYKTIKMHRFILGLANGDKRQTDHVNRDGLDNRRHNLRICNNKQNSQNRGKRVNSSSQYKGVSRRKNNKWQALIHSKGKTYYLGVYVDEKEAARVYDLKAKELFGEFANTNFKN